MLISKAVVRSLLLFCLSFGLVLSFAVLPARTEQAGLPLQPPLQKVVLVTPEGALGSDNQLFGQAQIPADRQALLQAIDYSLRYLSSPEAEAAYAQYPIPAFSRDRVRRSLVRFRDLLRSSRSPGALRSAVLREFDFYQSVGQDGQGTVNFTGYFEPVYAASRVQTSEFRYPLYRLPPDLAQWSQPHPTRQQLEGKDGLQGSQGRLRSLELVWLRDRLQAYLVQVQGSARLQLANGTQISVGYAGRTEYPYVSLGRELVNAGKIKAEDLSLPLVIQYFQDHPAELNDYLPRNNRFVFFKETTGTPATGSLGVPVTPERSIATDKRLMPPGALALIQTEIPYPDTQRQLAPQTVSRYVLDQDTGGAIQGAGRVDIFMGTGSQAGDRAGLIHAPGQLYYLLLKN